jgi:hypothetical protein
LPYVWHKPSAVGVKPTQRQFLGVLGYVFRTGFIDLEAQQVGGLGYEVRLGINEPGAPRLLLVVKAKNDQRRVGGGRRADDLVTAAFATDALVMALVLPVLVDLLFRFVILGSPEKPKGPGEGPLWQVWLQVIGGKLLAGVFTHY